MCGNHNNNNNNSTDVLKNIFLTGLVDSFGNKKCMRGIVKRRSFLPICHFAKKMHAKDYQIQYCTVLFLFCMLQLVACFCFCFISGMQEVKSSGTLEHTAALVQVVINHEVGLGALNALAAGAILVLRDESHFIRLLLIIKYKVFIFCLVFVLLLLLFIIYI